MIHKCIHCKEPFSTVSNLNRHIRKVHPKEWELSKKTKSKEGHRQKDNQNGQQKTQNLGQEQQKTLKKLCSIENCNFTFLTVPKLVTHLKEVHQLEITNETLTFKSEDG